MYALLLIGIVSAPAQAGKCDSYVNRAASSSGAALISNYERLIACDVKEAEANFTAFMTRATDQETLVDLSMTAVLANVWNPVWQMVGKISDYETRDLIAESIGGKCAEEEKVVGFLQGAYFGLRDVDFQQWDDALKTCQSETFDAWLLEQVQNPPEKQYDDKWGILAGAYVDRAGPAALPVLSAAAIGAAESGPYEPILTLMDQSVSEGFGDISPENQAALTQALMDIANQVSPEKARDIADRMLNAGDEASAASLLPRIYPDAVQSGGGFLYGAISAEACDDEKTVILHTAVFSEPGERYMLNGLADEQMRAVKARQKKCDVTSPWPVTVSSEPLNSAGELGGYTSTIQAEWEQKGYTVTKVQSEKDFAL